MPQKPDAAVVQVLEGGFLDVVAYRHAVVEYHGLVAEIDFHAGTDCHGVEAEIDFAGTEAESLRRMAEAGRYEKEGVLEVGHCERVLVDRSENEVVDLGHFENEGAGLEIG